MASPILAALRGALSILVIAIFADGAENVVLPTASGTSGLSKVPSDAKHVDAAPSTASAIKRDSVRPEPSASGAGERGSADATGSSTHAPCKRSASAWEQGMTKWANANDYANSPGGADAQQTAIDPLTGKTFRSDLEIESAILDNGTVVLSYFMPESGTPQFEMFDVLGQRLVSRRMGLQIPGAYTAEFPVPDRTRGTCFVQLRVGAKTSIKRTVRMGEP